MKRATILTMILLAALCTFAQSEERSVISTAGENDTLGHITVEWSIGEVATETFTDPDCILTQGFHQAYFKVLEILETTNPLQGIKVYPNPTTDILHVDLKGIDNLSEVELTLQNMEGKLLLHKKPAGDDLVRLHLQQYEEGLMILRITDPDSRAFTSFKIIKVNH